MLPIDPLPNAAHGKTLVGSPLKPDQRKSGQETLDGFQDVFEVEADAPHPSESVGALEHSAVVLPRTYSPGLPEQLLPDVQVAEPAATEVGDEFAVESQDKLGLADATTSPAIPMAETADPGLELADRAATSVQTDVFASETAMGVGVPAPLKGEDAKRSTDQESVRQPPTSSTLPQAAIETERVPRTPQSQQIAEAAITVRREIGVPPVEKPKNGTVFAGPSPTPPPVIAPPMPLIEQPKPVGSRGPKGAINVEKIPDLLTSAPSRQAIEASAKQTPPVSPLPNLSVVANPDGQLALRESVDRLQLFGADAVMREPGLHIGLDAAQRLRLTSSAAPVPALQTAQHATVSQQIATQISLQVGNARSGEIELRLEPEELGKLRITILPREMGLTLSIVAERPETLDLLRRNSDQLMADLVEMDLGGANLEFSRGEQGWASQDGSPATEVTEDRVTKAVINQGVPVPGRLDIRL